MAWAFRCTWLVWPWIATPLKLFQWGGWTYLWISNRLPSTTGVGWPSPTFMRPLLPLLVLRGFGRYIPYLLHSCFIMHLQCVDISSFIYCKAGPLSISLMLWPRSLGLIKESVCRSFSTAWLLSRYVFFLTLSKFWTPFVRGSDMYSSFV